MESGATSIVLLIEMGMTHPFLLSLKHRGPFPQTVLHFILPFPVSFDILCKKDETNMTFLLGYLLILNILTFAVYGLDKRSARHGGQRVPENVLLFLAGVGGTPAAYAARHYFRHKTIKRPFITRLRLILILQLGVVLLSLLLAFRGQA
jgi:uncharacterized membrane protein YsdA (DUF1294 family)